MPSKPDNRDKYQRYADNMKDRGYQKVHKWVPVRDVERLERYCERLRKAYEKEQRA